MNTYGYRIGNSLGAALVFGCFCLSLAANPAGAVPGHTDNDVHVARCACTDCHVVQPAEGDTLESAPLKDDSMMLCLSCHQDMPLRRGR